VSTTLLRHRHAAPEPTATPAPPPAQAPTIAGSGQVFVDDTGRRRRIVRRCAVALAVGAALYVAAVVGALGDTSVRPGVEVPADAGNGQVAGFPQDPGTPGLLTMRPAAPTHAPAPTPRPRATATPKPTPKPSAGPTTTPAPSTSPSTTAPGSSPAGSAPGKPTTSAASEPGASTTSKPAGSTASDGAVTR
jgi:hypothetical protein